MKIKSLKIKTEGNYIKISAKCKIRSFGYDEVYFKIEKKYESFIKADLSPFAAALLIPSMRRGEDLIIEGAISKELYKGMNKIMKILLSWDLGIKKIKIRAEKLLQDDQNSKFSASFFSGGVDSFYTYLHNKKEGNKIDYFVLINGYDIRLNNSELWKSTKNTISKIAKAEKVNVITVESNLFDLVDPVITWDYSFGGCVSAVALLLRSEIKKIYFSAGFRFDQVFPAGSHPLLDKLWGTEKLSIVHDGGDVGRLEKTKFIAHNSLVLKYLRVCYLNSKNVYNCGKCDKCLRTMISLKTAGSLSKSFTFPHQVNIEALKKLPIHAEYSAIFQRENLKELEKSKENKELADALKESLKHINPAPDPKEETLKRKILYFDHVYTLGITRKIIRKLNLQT